MNATAINSSNIERAAYLMEVLLASGAGALLITGRTYDGIGTIEQLVEAVRPPLLPPHLLSALEGGERFQLQSTQYSSDHVGGPAVTRTLVVRWRFEPTFNGNSWVIGEEQRATVAAQLRRLGSVPTAIVDAGVEVIAIWQLDQPIDLATCAGLQANMACGLLASNEVRGHSLSRGGQVLEEQLADSHPRVPIPVFGLVRELGNAAQQRIHIEHVDPSVRYALADLERAIAVIQAQEILQ